jgi:hypothetical protein
MIRYVSTLGSYKRKDRKTILGIVTCLDLAILTRAGNQGADFYEIWNACRPYKGKSGIKLYASNIQVKVRIRKLRKTGLLEIG